SSGRPVRRTRCGRSWRRRASNNLRSGVFPAIFLRSGVLCQVVANLTTTSYAVLSLLAVRPMTTYELAKQMQRTLRDVWPRAESVIYEEPKRLVEHRLATASTDMVGRRASTT